MARAVPPWLWSVLARDFAPRNAGVRLVIHTLRSFMSNDGITFVGQPLLAEASCLSKPTVRKALKIAWEAQWIGVALHRRGGQEWRNYEYRCCIPDGLQVPDVHEELVMKWAENHEEVDTETHPEMTRKVGKELSHVRGRNGASRVEGEQIGLSKVGKSDAKVGKLTTEGGQMDASKVGKPFAPKSYSEKLSVSSHQKVSPEEGRALPRATHLVADAGLRKAISEPEAETMPIEELPKAEREKAAAELMARIRDQPLSWIARKTNLTIEDLERLRNAQSPAAHETGNQSEQARIAEAEQYLRSIDATKIAVADLAERSNIPRPKARKMIQREVARQLGH